MPIPARNKSLFIYIISSFIVLFLFTVSPSIIPSTALAQNQVSHETLQSQSIPQYTAPNFKPGVPLNQHTFAQAAMIEAVSSAFCLLTGIDPTNPRQGCLDIDPQTGQLGLASPPGNEPKLGGLIGFIPGMFEQVYTPPASSITYLHYLASNFGIVKPANAAAGEPTGFTQLEPIQSMWISVRNVTYLLFVLIFVIIGLGIMLRIKIDPRTVMTLQNQIPRIITCILLITFSYAIVGLMIDLMWTATYAGINVVTMSNESVTNPSGCDPDKPGSSLQDRGTADLKETPITYGDNVLQSETQAMFNGKACGGIWSTALTMGRTIQDILLGLFNMLINLDNPNMSAQQKSRCNFASFLNLHGEGGFSVEDCIKDVTGYDLTITPGQLFATVIAWFAKIAAYVIITLIIVWNLFRVWLQLTRAYIMIILYAITGPLWIIMGLLPSKPLGFEKWFRRIFANLVVFPATALLFVMAAILINAFKNSSSTNAFVPPLVGNPNMPNFGYLIAFGIILVAPGLVDIIRSSIHATGKQGLMAIGSIQGSMNQGTAGGRGVGRAGWRRTFGINPYTGRMASLGQWIAGTNPNTARYKIVNAIGRAQGGDKLPTK